MSLPYPYPQRAGRDRNIVLADQSTFDGLPFRPTQTQAESLFRTDVYAGNDWYGTPYELQFSQQANTEESRAKAALIGGESGGGIFAGIMDIFGIEGKTFKTIADEFVVKYGLYDQSFSAGSSVPGFPPAPGEINLSAAQREKIIKNRIASAQSVFGSLVSQVKGLFNMAYDSPGIDPGGEMEPMELPGPAKEVPTGMIKAAAVLFIIYLVIQ